MNFFVRQALAFTNELRQASGALLGIVQGILADNQLNDKELHFLRSWLEHNATAAAAWPGNAIAAQIEAALADGVISDAEREHLVGVLQQLVGGTFDELAESRHVTELPLEAVEGVEFEQRLFCLTGDFCYGTRAACEAAVLSRGGQVTSSVTKKLHYLVVGGLGSAEWKHGSFGTKIEKAMAYKSSGACIRLIHEDPWAAALMAR